MKNSAIRNNSITQRKGNSPSFTLYESEVSRRILTIAEVEIFDSAFEKHSKDRASGSVHPRINYKGQLATDFSHATVKQTFLQPHAVIDPTIRGEFSDEEAVAIAAASKQEAEKLLENSRLENLRSETLKKLFAFYKYYISNIDIKVLERQQSPINDLPSRLGAEPTGPLPK